MKVITLDGPSGSGKTAVGPELARRFGMEFISLGCLFRAVAWCSSEGMAFKDLTLKKKENIYLPSIQGRLLDKELYQNPKIEELCARFAADPKVRDFIRGTILACSSPVGLIAEGRTAGKFFHSADCKIYLTADQEERYRRNLQESRRLGVDLEEEKLSAIRKKRDEADTDRQVDPLRISSDMIVWDSTHSTFEQTCDRLQRHIEHHVFQRKLKISVIIPVYNREEHLKASLLALSKQEIPSNEYEIIVVDDGSTDQSAKIALEGGAIVVQTSHVGPGAARNAGMAKATGDLIAFLDADILVKPDYLQLLRDRHAKTNDLVLLGARRHLPEGASSYENGQARLDSREKLLKRYSFCMSHLKHPWSLAYTCNFSLPRYLVENVRFDESFIGWGLEDIDFAFQLYQNGARIAFSTAICGYHLYHDRTFDAKRYQSWLQNLEKFLNKHPSEGVQSFILFKPVFNPDVLANYFDVFDQFEGRQPNLKSQTLNLSLSNDDPLQQIQTWLTQNHGSEVVLTDQEERIFYEVYLPFLPRGRIQSFMPLEKS